MSGIHLTDCAARVRIAVYAPVPRRRKLKAAEDSVEKRTARMYLQDTATLIISVLVMWSALGCVLCAALPLTDDARVRIFLEVSAAAVGIFATAALLAVLAHLRRNRDALYREDLAHLDERQGE